MLGPVLLRFNERSPDFLLGLREETVGVNPPKSPVQNQNPHHTVVQVSHIQLFLNERKSLLMRSKPFKIKVLVFTLLNI